MMHKWTKMFGVAACIGMGVVGWSALSSAQQPAPANDPTLPAIPVLPKPTNDLPPLKPLDPVKIDEPTLSLPSVSPAPMKLPEVTPAKAQDMPKPLTIEPITDPKIPEIKPLPEVKTPEIKPLTPLAPTPISPLEPGTIRGEKPVAESPTLRPTSMVMGADSMGVMSKQEPSVSLEWAGPQAVKVGQPAIYTLHVRNTCAIAVQKVVVQVRLPKEVNVSGVEPRGEVIEGVHLWDLGTLMPKQEKTLKMNMLAPGKGEMNCQAWVTFTGSASMKLMVREPKLLVKASAPDKVLMGDPANITLTISNPGDFTTDAIKLTASLGEGLEGLRGNKMTQDIGSLAPGETRTIQMPCVTKTGGSQKCEVFVEADGGLKAVDTVAVNVVTPQLNLEVIGPKLRYLDRKAVYTFKITNPGDAPANNVFITDVVPAGFKFVQADGGGQMDAATSAVKWFVGEVAPGQSKEVKVELMAVNQGEQVQKVMANGSRGIKTAKELSTRVEGLSALSMEVVDTEDPVEVGHDTTYEIRIANTGSKTEESVKLSCTIPPQMKLKSASGPVKYDVVGNEVVFETLSKLTPKADVLFKVTCTAKTKGDARFKATLTAGSLVEPVTKQESTKVYED